MQRSHYFSIPITMFTSLLLTTAAYGASNSEIYGHLRFGVDNHVEDLKSVRGKDCKDKRSSVLAKDDYDCSVNTVNTSSFNSFIGWKGDTGTQSGAQAYYQLEFGVHANSNDDTIGDYTAISVVHPVLSRRNQFVGLRGGLGDISIGRNDNVLKQSKGNVDLFYELHGGIGYLLAGERRQSGVINYYYSFGSSKIGLSATPKDTNNQYYAKPNKTTVLEAKNPTGYAVSYSFGDPELQKSHSYFALAYSDDYPEYDHRFFKSAANQGDVFRNDVHSALMRITIIRASAQFKFSSFTIGALVQQQQTDKTQITEQKLKMLGSAGYGTKKDDKALLGSALSLAYDANDFTIKGQAVMLTDVGNSFTLGFDYNIAQNTKAFFQFTMRSDDVKVASEEKSLYAVDYQFASFGLTYDF